MALNNIAQTKFSKFYLRSSGFFLLDFASLLQKGEKKEEEEENVFIQIIFIWANQKDYKVVYETQQYKML